PKLVSVKRGETEYGIAAIPAGGYVRISGMNPDDVLPEGEEHRGYYDMPVWKRIVVIGAGPAVNGILACAILFAVFLTSAGTAGSRVHEVEPKTPAAGVLKPGDRIVAVDGRTFAGLHGNERFERIREQVGTHRCPGAQTDKCIASTPVRVQVERDGKLRTFAI